MIIAVPKETKNNELRVAITPAGVSEFVAHGHQAGAGIGSGIEDAHYFEAGARIAVFM